MSNMLEPFMILSSIFGSAQPVLVRADWPESDSSHFTPVRLDAPHGPIRLSPEMDGAALVMVVLLAESEVGKAKSYAMWDDPFSAEYTGGTRNLSAFGEVVSAYVTQPAKGVLCVRVHKDGEMQEVPTERVLFCLQTVGGHYLAEGESYADPVFESREADQVMNRKDVTKLLDLELDCWLVPVPIAHDRQEGEMALTLYGMTNTHLVSLGEQHPMLVIPDHLPSSMQGFPFIHLADFKDLYDVERNIFTRSDVQHRMSLCLNSFKQAFSLRTGLTSLMGPFQSRRPLRSVFGMIEFRDDEANFHEYRDTTRWDEWVARLETVKSLRDSAKG
jgi:hypothetical protein